MDNGLFILGQLVKIDYAKEANGWDNLVFEAHQQDERLGKSVPVAITALLPSSMKGTLNEFQPLVGNSQCIVPVAMRKSKSSGGSFLIVTGSPVDPTLLLTQ